jgi:hypothetical protein
MLLSGFGAHRIEGIGDKHIPWIHNVRNTDMAIAIDDEDVMSLMRLFNEPAGRQYLIDDIGVPEDVVSRLDLLGISSIANLLMCVKYARYYELTGRDVVLTVFTDSMDLYRSRLREARERLGGYSEKNAIRDHSRCLLGQKTDAMLELTHYQRRQIHNLKYFTWIEQQGFDLDELNRQWHEYEDYWQGIRDLTPEIDRLIVEFNERVGQI